jgi:hypothetical protein
MDGVRTVKTALVLILLHWSAGQPPETLEFRVPAETAQQVEFFCRNGVELRRDGTLTIWARGSDRVGKMRDFVADVKTAVQRERGRLPDKLAYSCREIL